MGILSSFFDVVAGVSILAGRSSLLDTNLTTIAGRNFTVRGALGLSFLSVGFINLMATSRKQRKIERLTKEADTFNASGSGGFEYIQGKQILRNQHYDVNYTWNTDASHIEDDDYGISSEVHDIIDDEGEYQHGDSGSGSYTYDGAFYNKPDAEIDYKWNRKETYGDIVEEQLLAEEDEEGLFYDELEEKIEAKEKEIRDFKEYLDKVGYGRQEIRELNSMEQELEELEEMEFKGAENFNAEAHGDWLTCKDCYADRFIVSGVADDYTPKCNACGSHNIAIMSQAESFENESQLFLVTYHVYDKDTGRLTYEDAVQITSKDENTAKGDALVMLEEGGLDDEEYEIFKVRPISQDYQKQLYGAETFEGELKVGVLGDFEGHEEGKLGADKVATYTLDNGKIVEVYECYTIMSKDGMVTGKRIDFYDLFDKEGSLNEGEPWWPEAGVPSREVVNDVFGAESFNAPAAVMRTYKGRKSPSISAKSVKVGTRKRGNDGKMWQVRSVRSRGKRTQRWFKD